MWSRTYISSSIKPWIKALLMSNYWRCQLLAAKTIKYPTLVNLATWLKLYLKSSPLIFLSFLPPIWSASLDISIKIKFCLKNPLWTDYISTRGKSNEFPSLISLKSINLFFRSFNPPRILFSLCKRSRFKGIQNRIKTD